MKRFASNKYNFSVETLFSYPIDIERSRRIRRAQSTNDLTLMNKNNIFRIVWSVFFLFNFSILFEIPSVCFASQASNVREILLRQLVEIYHLSLETTKNDATTINVFFAFNFS